MSASPETNELTAPPQDPLDLDTTLGSGQAETVAAAEGADGASETVLVPVASGLSLDASENAAVAPAPPDTPADSFDQTPAEPPADDEDTAVLESELASLPARMTGGADGDTGPGSPRSLSKRVLGTAAATLDLLNAPLQRLDPLAKSLVGLGALATLLVCGFANFVLPGLLKPRTALTFLEEQITALHAPAPAVAADHAAESAGGH